MMKFLSKLVKKNKYLIFTLSEYILSVEEYIELKQ